MRNVWRLGLALLPVLFGAKQGAAQRHAPTGTVTITTGNPTNTFVLSKALGAGVDGYEQGDVERIYQPENIRAMRSVGFKPLSYRLRTELGIQSWHWNPQGQWSDAAHRQGYWTSNDTADAPLSISNGYSLPRRGNTIDQANNRSYSRLDDGDLATFWKSNPYLTSFFTHEPDGFHPQWVVIDLGKKTPLDAIRIAWGTPCAVRYQVEWWTGQNPIFLDGSSDSVWRVFPLGRVTNGHGGDVTLRLSKKSMRVRFVRILMQRSSGAPASQGENRDAMGYAIREIYAGRLDAKGKLRDAIRHGKTKDDQTLMYASSTD